MIDLHTHSSESDGTDSPAELIANAVAAGIRTIALTDHDTTAGWQEAVQAVERLPQGFTLIRGTEFSCVHHDEHGQRVGVHLLGYLFDPSAPSLKAERARLRADRLSRGERIVNNLIDAGYPITWSQVTRIARGGVVGRPHIGQALVASGVVDSVNGAFEELLHNRSPYYVPKQDMAVTTAVELIREAGGVPVLAHPWARRRGRVLAEGAIAELAAAGMLGIEVDHPDHAAEDRARLRQLAADLDLVMTGSSDYHGTNKTVALGAEHTDPQQLDRLVGLSRGVELIRSAVR